MRLRLCVCLILVKSHNRDNVGSRFRDIDSGHVTLLDWEGERKGCGVGGRL